MKTQLHISAEAIADCYTKFTPQQLRAMHVEEHRRMFPNSNPVQIEGCCCAVAFEYRKRLEPLVCGCVGECAGHTDAGPMSVHAKAEAPNGN